MPAERSNTSQSIAPFISSSLHHFMRYNERTNLVTLKDRDCLISYHPNTITLYKSFDQQCRHNEEAKMVPSGYDKFAEIYNRNTPSEERFCERLLSRGFRYHSHTRPVGPHLLDFANFPVTSGYFDPRLRTLPFINTNGSLNTRSYKVYDSAAHSQLEHYQKREERQRYGGKRFNDRKKGKHNHNHNNTTTSGSSQILDEVTDADFGAFFIDTTGDPSASTSGSDNGLNLNDMPVFDQLMTDVNSSSTSATGSGPQDSSSTPSATAGGSSQIQ
ncbi:hypothetical protein BJ165DRAFT_1511865 [Panaeolus papilionaceus]|nr:hypothetical protein BJ165DRAFT_1511865 [Panaeolus papilionaceus]